MNTKNIWPAVIVAGMCLTAVTVLALAHADTTEIMAAISAVAVPLLGFLLYGKVESIKEQTNGNTTRQMDLIQDLVNHLKWHSTVSAAAPTPADQPNGGIPGDQSSSSASTAGQGS